jgi:hypothetical protein
VLNCSCATAGTAAAGCGITAADPTSNIPSAITAASAAVAIICPNSATTAATTYTWAAAAIPATTQANATAARTSTPKVSLIKTSKVRYRTVQDIS